MVSSALSKSDDPPFKEILLHTGQHYDENMSKVFFDELDLRPADINLEVGSGTSGFQLARMVEGLEQVIRERQPSAVMAYGDTHSTLAAALISAHTNTPFIHVEAGERLYRRHMIPEEVNRVICDNVAHLCLTSTPQATDFLAGERFDSRRVKFVGDPMFELFLIGKDKLSREGNDIVNRLGLSAGEYHLATIHRAENTATLSSLLSILTALDSAKKTVVLPVHPRVKAMLEGANWAPSNNLRLIDALGYFDFLAMLLDSHRVVTDSGGVSREAFFAQKPSIIPLEDTHWQGIEKAGWSVCTSTDSDRLASELDSFEPESDPPSNLFGDGKSGVKIVQAIGQFLANPVAYWAPDSLK